jgi:hypothetical protein
MMAEASVSQASMARGQRKLGAQLVPDEASRLYRHRPRPREALAANLRSLARAQAVRSRRAQDLPDHITDPATLDYVARLLVSTNEPPPAGVPP